MRLQFIIWSFVFAVPFAIGQELKIATFNCEFLNKKKVHIKYGLSFNLNSESDSIQQFWANETNRLNKLEEATIEVAKHIQTIDADVIGLTEVGKVEDVELLVQALKDLGLNYRYMEVGKSTDYTTGQHVAFLSKYKLRKVESSFENRGLYFTEEDLDEVEETGISKGMKAMIKVDGNEIYLFLLHLKSERGGYESDQQRIKQAELIRNESLTLLNENKHVIILGDFNSEKRNEELLTLRGFNDIYPELIQTGDSDYFGHSSIRWTYEFEGEREQIDHILMSISLSKLCYRNTSTRMGIESSILETGNSFVSDHNAFVVSLLFR